jgi:CspA family cold shock protein
MNTNSQRRRGIVKYWNTERDFGYIACYGQADVFFKGSNLLGDNPQTPCKGNAVTFEIVRTHRGSVAADICVLTDPQSVAAFNAWMTPAREQARQEHDDTQSRLETWFKRGRVKA